MDVHVPLITPFDEDGGIATAALTRLAHQVLDDGAAGIVALGTTAEPGSLSAAERAEVLDLLGAIGRERRVQLTVGTDDPRELAGYPAVTAALVRVPPFVRPGEDGVVAWFEALPKPVPVIAYHVPLRTGQDLSAAAIRRLAAIDGVIGMKYAPTTLDADAVDLLTDPPPGFTMLAATDVLLTPMIALGATGAILASANVAHETSDRLRSALFAEPNPTVIKGVLHAQGKIPTPGVRLPLLPASRTSVDAALHHLAQAFRPR
ncbi:dihydrodipicolinate synthase family protein [Actinoplanes sp. NPDC049265]|uniref:dihydrodipicolinate synthase family protein n=1 Tax=Actinoplanes sp. NPDC049265 TaxID=3363902 RepID=UPI003718DAE9